MTPKEPSELIEAYVKAKSLTGDDLMKKYPLTVEEAFQSCHIGKETAPPLVKYLEAVERIEELTQQQTINENIITQYEIKVQQDISKVNGLELDLRIWRKTGEGLIVENGNLREELENFKELLMQVDHTLSVHGKIDINTPLHQRIEHALQNYLK